MPFMGVASPLRVENELKRNEPLGSEDQRGRASREVEDLKGMTDRLHGV